MTTTIDRLATSDLPDRYGIAKGNVYKRLKALEITPDKQGAKSYIYSEEIQLMDSMDNLIKAGKTLQESADILLSQNGNIQTESIPVSSVSANGQGSRDSITRQYHETNDTTQLAMMQALASIVQSNQTPPAPPDPLERFRQLKEIVDEGWLLSSSDLAPIVGLGKMPSKDFERYGFRFIRSGKNGVETAWKVEKLEG
jgi:hypothetical protein